MARHDTRPVAKRPVKVAKRTTESLYRGLEVGPSGWAIINRLVPPRQYRPWPAQPPDGPKSDSEIVGRAVNLIKPKEEEKVSCSKNVASTFLCLLCNGPDSNPLPEWKKRKQHASVLRDLKKLKLTIEVTSEQCRSDLFGGLDRAHQFCEELGRLASTAELHHNATVVTKGARPLDMQKLAAAIYAYHLLKDYKKPPTLTVGGAFFELASVLYEGIRGRENENLEWYCRQVSELEGRSAAALLTLIADLRANH